MDGVDEEQATGCNAYVDTWPLRCPFPTILEGASNQPFLNLDRDTHGVLSG